MSLIELPRALEDYFACAEIDPTRRGRRFSITLNFYNGERLDRLQWWYHVSPAQEQMFEGTGLVVFRERAIERFRTHIERWLANTQQYLFGTEPIPRLGKRNAVHVEALPPPPSSLPDLGGSDLDPCDNECTVEAHELARATREIEPKVANG